LEKKKKKKKGATELVPAEEKGGRGVLGVIGKEKKRIILPLRGGDRS